MRTSKDSSSQPSASTVTGPEIVISVITAVITFGRSSSGARVVMMAISGAVATAPSPAANITAMTPIAGKLEAQQEQRRRDPEDRRRRQRGAAAPFAPAGSPTMAADHGPCPERAEHQPGRPRAGAVVVVRKHRQRDEDRLREHVQEDGGGEHRPQQPSLQDEAQARRARRCPRR